jgi:hypothetical protein
VRAPTAPGRTRRRRDDRVEPAPALSSTLSRWDTTAPRGASTWAALGQIELPLVDPHHPGAELAGPLNDRIKVVGWNTRLQRQRPAHHGEGLLQPVGVP